MNGAHVPVLPEEVIEALSVTPGKRYIDATVGLGGHAIEILRRGGILLGIDQDKEALEIAQKHLKGQGTYQLVHGNFRDIEHIANESGMTNVSGVLFDLGVSSFQLDTPERGFSYRFIDAPLDLRMDRNQGETAAQLINRLGSEALYDVLATFGEEQLAGPIADALFLARSVKHIETVGDVVKVVEALVKDERKVHGVLSRVFQALRIAVNDELASLKEGLQGAKNVLEPGGKLVVISFHSLEDRIVKQFVRAGGWQVITKHPIQPILAELERNRRSRSAKLRVAIKQ